MDEHHTAVLNWEGSPEAAEQMVACANDHQTEVVRNKQAGGVRLTLTMRRSDLQTLRDDMDALLVALADIGPSDS